MTTALRSATSEALIRRAIAPSISLRITPELPRAPRSAPREKAASASDREVSGSASSAAARVSRADETVRYMLVPVSPSGTG